jgi:catechol 2,3-dioxygenase-like lactoylglutathione lyase family enzyme
LISEQRAHATLPVQDLDRARAFYEAKLGFTPEVVAPSAVMYKTGAGSVFAVTLSTGRASGDHTQLGFTVDDIGAEVADLKRRGVTFEEYDLADFKTVDSVAQTGPNRAAWFRDPDGNLIGLIEFS